MPGCRMNLGSHNFLFLALGISEQNGALYEELLDMQILSDRQVVSGP